MAEPRRNAVDELRGAGRLAVDATARVTDLVEEMHRTIAAGPAILGRPLERVTAAVIAPVYAGIRGVARLIGGGIDEALGRLAQVVGETDAVPSGEREAIVAALGGVLGDYLAETGNPLAITMTLRMQGRALVLDREALRAALPEATPRLAVLVHGSCMNDLQWRHDGHDHGDVLAARGWTPVYVHYNSGLHISSNGRALADLLEQVHDAWPVELAEIALVGHSMGGLVSRSAAHHGSLASQRWRARLRQLVCLGSPHHGAALERGGNWVEPLLGTTRYSRPLARLGRLRSAGVTDLRYGYVRDEDWRDRDRFALGTDDRTPLPLPTDVDCSAVAATRSPSPRTRLAGDGLVSVTSALGQHDDPARALGFAEDRRRVVYGCNHLGLLAHPEVTEQLARWFSD